MGNCLGTCFGQAKRKTNYFVGRYKDYNVSIEFENLIEDEHVPASDTPVITKSERQHLLNKKYTDLESDQRRKNAELDAELRRQEENLKIEEDAMNEAKREAARLAKQAKVQEQEKKKKKVTANGTANKPSWLGDDDDWDVAGGEDDFEMFLDTVKARSQAVRANGFLGNTVGSSQPYRRGGENAITKATPKTSMPSASTAPSQRQQQQQYQVEKKDQDSDLEWDSDFVSADTDETNAKTVSGGKSFRGKNSDVNDDSDFVSADTEEINAKTVSGGKSFSGTNSDMNDARTNENIGKVASPQKIAQPVAAKTGDQKVVGTNNNVIPKDSGIDVKPPVQLPNSTSQSNSKPSDSMLNPTEAATTTPKTNVLSNSVFVQETVPAAATSNSARTEDPVGATDDGIAEGQGSTKVVEDSTEDLDEFDIDKFLEELDLET